MKFILISLSLLAFAICAQAQETTILSTIEEIEDEINNAIKTILDQIPEDPIIISDVDLPLINSNAIKLNIGLTNFKIENLKTLNVTCNKISVAPMGANLLLTLPHIEVSTNYTLSAEISSIPALTANGDIHFTLTNLTVECDTHFEVLQPIKIRFNEFLIKLPEFSKNTKITLNIVDEQDPNLAQSLNDEASADIPLILNYIDQNQEGISNTIGPIIVDIINSILSQSDNNTTPTTTPTPTPSPTPAPGSASVASFSVITLLATLICINVL